MDITTLAAYGEFIGGIAVVVSLVYLAGQIRQNSKLLRASTASVAQQSSSAVNNFIVQDPELARIFFAGLADRDALPDADVQRFDPLLSVAVNEFQVCFRLAREEIISPETWTELRQQHQWSMRQPGFRQWWSQWGGVTYSGRFKDYIEDAMSEAEVAG